MASDRSGIKVTASDALEFEAVAPKVQKGGSGLKTMMFVLIAVVVGAGAWAFYGERVVSMFGNSTSEVQVIYADISPVKVRPENPGGLQVPDRDKLVYNRIQNGGTEPTGKATVERLLPLPETPLPRPEATMTKNPTIAETPKVSDVTAAVEPTPAPPPPSAPLLSSGSTAKAPEAVTQPVSGPTRLSKNTPDVKVSPPSVQPQPIPAPEKTEPAKTEPVKTAALPKVPVSKASSASTPAPSKKVYRVQLAAARTHDAARSEWDRLRRRNLELLGDLGMSVTKVDLGGSKGIFYRLRAGPLKDEQVARKLCKALVNRKVGCLVVRPGK